MKLEPENAIVEAWRLQESIKKKRAEIRAEENQLKQIMALLESFNVTRIGKLERVSRLQHKRSIIPDQFRDRWPDLFNSLARVTLKDAPSNTCPRMSLTRSARSRRLFHG